MIEHLSEKYPGCAWEFVSRKPARTVFRLVRQGAAEYYVKFYDTRGLRERLKSLLRPKIPHEAFMLWLLGMSGIPAAKVREHLRLPGADAIVTDAVPEASGLPASSRDRQVEVMLDLGLTLINHGYHFSDLHPRNIVLDAAGLPHLVDAYGIRPCRRITLENAASLFAQVARHFGLSEHDLHQHLVRIDAIRDVGMLKKRIRRLCLAA
jgi:hypothetical protein